MNSAPDAPPAIKQTYQLLTAMAAKKNTTPAAVALAWIMCHPAGIIPITGSQKPEHIVENCAADRVSLSRPEWYNLLTTASGSTMTKVL